MAGHSVPQYFIPSRSIFCVTEVLAVCFLSSPLMVLLLAAVPHVHSTYLVWLYLSALPGSHGSDMQAYFFFLCRCKAFSPGFKHCSTFFHVLFQTSLIWPWHYLNCLMGLIKFCIKYWIFWRFDILLMLIWSVAVTLSLKKLARNFRSVGPSALNVWESSVLYSTCIEVSFSNRLNQ